MTLIRVRRDAADHWSATNPILKSGEFGLDETNRILKIGNGTDPWADLDVIASADTLTETTWATIEGKPPYVGAGDSPEAARGAIGAYGPGDIPLFVGWDSPTEGQYPGWSEDSNSLVPKQLPSFPSMKYKPDIIALPLGAPIPPDFDLNNGIIFTYDASLLFNYAPLGQNGQSTTVTTKSTAIQADVAVNDYVIVGIVAGTSANGVLSTGVGVTDSKGNVYTKINDVVQTTVQGHFFYSKIQNAMTVTAGDVFTVNMGGPLGDVEIVSMKSTGLATAAADASGSAKGLSKTTIPIVNTGDTAQNHELEVILQGSNTVGQTINMPSGDGWTQVGTTQNGSGSQPRFAAMFARVLTTIETQASSSVDLSVTQSGTIIGLRSTFKIAS